MLPAKCGFSLAGIITRVYHEVARLFFSLRGERFAGLFSRVVALPEALQTSCADENGEFT